MVNPRSVSPSLRSLRQPGAHQPVLARGPLLAGSPHIEQRVVDPAPGPDKRTGRIPTEQELAARQRARPILNQLLTGKGLAPVAEEVVYVTGLRGPLEAGGQDMVQRLVNLIFDEFDQGSAAVAPGSRRARASESIRPVLRVRSRRLLRLPDARTDSDLGSAFNGGLELDARLKAATCRDRAAILAACSAQWQLWTSFPSIGTFDSWFTSRVLEGARCARSRPARARDSVGAGSRARPPALG